MGRVLRALTSLVAAIPAGFLCFQLVSVLMNQADSLKGMTQILVIGTLVLAAFIALMPFAILIFGGKKKAANSAAAASGVGLNRDDADAGTDSSGEIELADDELDDESLADSSAFDLNDSDADVLSDGDNDNFDDVDDFDIDEEDEKPKKGGKKKR